METGSSSATTLPPEAAVELVSAAPATDALVDAWFVETFHNQGFDAPLFNRFRAAADELKRRLRAQKE